VEGPSFVWYFRGVPACISGSMADEPVSDPSVASDRYAQYVRGAGQWRRVAIG
jgi:hypothetical protein